MIGSGEAESRAVASAVRGAVAQARLDAGVNIAGLLVDLDVAVSADARQLFMCWHLTRVLGPTLTEMLPPATVRGVVSHGNSTAHQEGRLTETPATTVMPIHGASPEPLSEDWVVMVNDGCRCGPAGDQPSL